MKHLFLVLAVLIATGLSLSCAIAGELVSSPAVINWEKGVCTAGIETRLPKAATDAAASKLLSSAKETTRNKAVSSVLTAIESTAVDSFHLGRDFLKNPIVRQALISFISSGCLSESVVTVAGVPVVKVRVEVPLLKVFRLFISKNAPNTISKDIKSIRVQIPEKRIGSLNKDLSQSGPFTSVIIDTTGQNVLRSMSPKIRREDGSEVWGTVKVDDDFVLDIGIVAYAKSLEEAKKSNRAGKAPLIIKALGKAGGKYYCDAVVSNEDAKLILAENAKNHICDDFRVIFVIDTQSK